jgi:hypothetical protein
VLPKNASTDSWRKSNTLWPCCELLWLQVHLPWQQSTLLNLALRDAAETTLHFFIVFEDESSLCTDFALEFFVTLFD